MLVSRHFLLAYAGNVLSKRKATPRFELGISCLLDRRFNQLSHGAPVCTLQMQEYYISIRPRGARLGKPGKKFAPNVGLEPTTLRLRVSCSTD